MSYSFRSFMRGEGREDGEPDTITHIAAKWNNFTTESTREQFVAYAVGQGMAEDVARQATDEKFAAVAAERREIKRLALTRRTPPTHSSAGASRSIYSVPPPRETPRMSSHSGKTFENDQWENAYQNLLSRGHAADLAHSIIEENILKENTSKTKQEQTQGPTPDSYSQHRGTSPTTRRSAPSRASFIANASGAKSPLPIRHVKYMECLVSRGQTEEDEDAEEFPRLRYESEQRQGPKVTGTQDAYRENFTPSGPSHSSSRSRSTLPQCYQDQIEAAVSEGGDRDEAEKQFRERYQKDKLYGQQIRQKEGNNVSYIFSGPKNLSYRTNYHPGRE